jgi:ATP-dependent Clp protease adaptor protein ClpS
MNLFFMVSLVLAVVGAIALQQQRQYQHQSSSTKASGFAAFRPSAVTVVAGRRWGSISNSLRETSIVMMGSSSSTIEREQVRTGGPAVLDRPVTERKEKVDSPVKERSPVGGEAWEVRIYNDGMNTREHVARSLVQITGMTEMTAYQTMMMAHQNGIASVGRFCFEIAEMYNEGLRTQGIISDIVPVDEDQ